MKYKDIHIYSHQRSGSHYFAALLSMNIFGEQDYRGRYRNHPIGKKIEHRIDKNKDILFAYIFRSFEDTAKSIFKMRDRFGLAVDDYDVFLNTKYKDMWSSNLNFEIKINFFGEEKLESKVSTYFKNINKTPLEFWEHHRNFWLNMEKKHTNVIITMYDDLIKDLDSELSKIEKKMGAPKGGRKNIGEQIGWIPVKKEV